MRSVYDNSRFSQFVLAETGRDFDSPVRSRARVRSRTRPWRLGPGQRSRAWLRVRLRPRLRPGLHNDRPGLWPWTRDHDHGLRLDRHHDGAGPDGHDDRADDRPTWRHHDDGPGLRFTTEEGHEQKQGEKSFHGFEKTPVKAVASDQNSLRRGRPTLTMQQPCRAFKSSSGVNTWGWQSSAGI